MKMIAGLIFLLSSAQAAPIFTAPEKAAQNFYESYVKYQRSLEGKIRTEAQSKAQDAKAIKPFVTKAYFDRLAKLRKKCAASHDDIPEGCDYDPFLCAQEAPLKIVKATTDASPSPQTSLVEIGLCFGSAKNCETRTVKVHMQLAGAKWLVGAVDCP